MKPDQEQVEHQLLDALLHEQRRSDREQVIADIEVAIDEVKKPDHSIARPVWPRRIGIIAASIALGGITAFWVHESMEVEPEMVKEDTKKSTQEERAEMAKAIRDLEDKVEESRKILTTISRTRDFVYPEDQQRLTRLEEDRLQLEAQIENLLKYDSEQLFIYASGIDLPDNIVKTLYPQYLELKRQIDKLEASGFGKSHPTVVSNVRVLKSMRSDLDEAVVNLRTRLQGRLEMTNERLAKVETKNDATHMAALERSIDTQDYQDAKRDFEADLNELRRLQLGQLGNQAAEVNGLLAANEPQQQKGAYDEDRLAGLRARNGLGPPPLPDVASNKNPSGHVGRDENFGKGWGEAGDGGGGFGDLNGAKFREGPVAVPVEPSDTERYGPLVDPTWQRPTENPLSTFSIDVDTASYANIRRFIREGRNIPADAVRIEECINAFKYHYEPPAGDEAFAVHTELVTCPWNENNRLVKFGIKGREIAREKRPVSNLVFLIDVSGSMQAANKLPLVKESLKLLIHQLDERDSVSYVVYAGREGVVLPPTKMTESGRVQALQALEKLEAGGSTNGGAGIKRAYELAAENFIEGGVNRVILASDGDFNVGVTGKEALVSLVKERAAKNIYLSALAFGTGNLNDSMFEAISNDGNGNYFYIDSIRESRKVFLENLAGSLITIAKDVKIQVEFNPAKVGSYRLIGYANRVLKDEDFNNDKVDAGDIGAGHTVTAFYEIVPAGVTQPGVGGVDALKYQETEAKPPAGAGPADEWLTLRLRHKHPEGDISALQETVVKGEATAWQEAGSDLQFASAVALFGMKLRGMNDVSEIAWEGVRQLTTPGLRNDEKEDRADFVELVGELEKRDR